MWQAIRGGEYVCCFEFVTVLFSHNLRVTRWGCTFSDAPCVRLHVLTLYICMYIYMYNSYMYVYMYVYIYIYTYRCMSIFI